MKEERTTEEWDVEMALRGELKRLALILLEALGLQDLPRSVIGDELETLAKWLPTVQSRNFVGAFWKEVLRVAEGSFWEVIKANLEGGHIILAKARAVRLVEFLDHYEVLFGLKPPEEEEVPEAPSVVEEGLEPEPEPWEALGISKESYERPLKEILGGGFAGDVTRITNKIAKALDVPSPEVRAGPALEKLNEVDWKPGWILGIGRTSIKILRQKFEFEGYPVPPEKPKGLPRG